MLGVDLIVTFFFGYQVNSTRIAQAHFIAVVGLAFVDPLKVANASE